MIEALEFIFSSFWRWFGTFILLLVIADGIGGFIDRVTKVKR